MDTKQISFRAISEINVNPNGENAELSSAMIGLQISRNADPSFYYNEDQKDYSAEGYKVLSQCMIQGLAASIHAAHDKRLRDSAEHLRWAIRELENSFIQNVDISKIIKTADPEKKPREMTEAEQYQVYEHFMRYEIASSWTVNYLPQWFFGSWRASIIARRTLRKTMAFFKFEKELNKSESNGR